MAVGRLTTTPSAPSAPCSQSRTTVCRKFGSRKDGAAIRKTPFASGALIFIILPRWFMSRKRHNNSNSLKECLCCSLLQPNKRDKSEKPASLSVEGFSSVTEQIVVRREGFVSRIGRIDLDYIELFLVAGCAIQNRPLRGDNFAIPDKRQ